MNNSAETMRKLERVAKVYGIALGFVVGVIVILWIASFCIFQPAPVIVFNDTADEAVIRGCDRPGPVPDVKDVAANKSIELHPDSACMIFIGGDYAGCLTTSHFISPARVRVSSTNPNISEYACDWSRLDKPLTQEEARDAEAHNDHITKIWALVALLILSGIGILILGTVGTWIFLDRVRSF
jgi:hypothetical protein